MNRILARKAAQLSIVLQMACGIVAAVGRYAGKLALAPSHAYHRAVLCMYEGPGDLKTLNEAMEKAFKDMKEKIDQVGETATKALEESKKEGTIHKETNDKLTEVVSTAKTAQDSVKELKDRMLDIEQKLAKRPGGGGGDESKSAGQIFAESEQLKHALKERSDRVASVNVGRFHRKAIISDPAGTNPQALVGVQRVPGIIMPALRRLTIRDLLPQMSTDLTVIYYAKENVFTNNAAIVFSSPNDRENVTKPESGISFTSASANVETLAHWIQASRQILADAKGLRDYIDARLEYGLKLAEEAELLTGDGSNGHLNGLQTQATAYNRGVSNDTVLDTLLKMLLQVSLSYYVPDGFVLHPIDWTERVLLAKDTTGRYLFSDPHSVEAPRVWAQPVVPTQAQTQSVALAGSFALGAAIWDREDANVRVSENTNDDFIKNMVRILAEERMALTVYRPAAFVKATLPAAGT
jgi:HK97 family phage major capsid protein